MSAREQEDLERRWARGVKEARVSVKVRGVGSNPTGSTPSKEGTIAGVAKRR